MSQRVPESTAHSPDGLQVLANTLRVPKRSVGAIVAFSTGTDHRIVAVAGRRRFLIAAR